MKVNKTIIRNRIVSKLVPFLFILVIVLISCSVVLEKFEKKKNAGIASGTNYEENYKNNASGDTNNPMCQTWTDKNGTVLWEGLTKEEYAKTNSKQRKEFEEWFSNFSSELVGNSLIIPIYTERVRTHFSNLCIQNADKIPYLSDGREYGLGFVNVRTFTDKRPIDNYSYGVGLDDKGYIIWLFRNTFGFTPDELKNFDSIKDVAKKVNKLELKTGDICYSTVFNLYGVVAGFYDNMPIVAYCDALPTNTFLYGSSKISYIKSFSMDYIYGTRPKEFNMYYRLNLDWED